jgi:hypothetical protein
MNEVLSGHSGDIYNTLHVIASICTFCSGLRDFWFIENVLA